MGSQATNLGVQLFELLGVGGLGHCQTVAALEKAGKVLERLIAPGAQDIRMDAMLSGELVERLGLLQELQDNLGLEGGTVRSFHTVILPNPGVLTVQILGSIIRSGGMAGVHAG